MNEILKIVLSLSLSGSLLILVLLLCKPLFRARISKRWQYYIWLVIIARLLLPFTPETSPVGTLFHQVDRIIVQADTAPTPRQNIAPILRDNTVIKNETAPKSGETDVAPIPQRFFSVVIQNLCLAWLVMALILLIRKITIYQDFVKYIRAGHAEVSDTAILDRLALIGEKAGIKRPVELYTNSLITSPLLLGFFRPCIVLPSTDLALIDLDYTLLHELTHYKRRDMFYKWLVQFAICLHWFNPLVYVMGREVGRTCELACDETVIKVLDPQGRRAYGDTLLNAIGVGGSYKDTLASVTLNENRELLKERLGAIMKYKKKTKATIVITSLLTILLTIGAISMGAYAASEISFADNEFNHFDNPINTESIPPDRMLQDFQSESYYRDFYALMTDENYEISGTIYQNINPRSLVRFEKLSDTKLTISGNMSLVEGEIKLVYKDEAGTLVTIAEGKAENEEPVSIFYEIETSEKGEIYFEATSAICKFDLKFSNADGTSYFLTEVNPIGLTY